MQQGRTTIVTIETTRRTSQLFLLTSFLGGGSLLGQLLLGGRGSTGLLAPVFVSSCWKNVVLAVVVLLLVIPLLALLLH
jgi:hypothetical protein